MALITSRLHLYKIPEVNYEISTLFCIKHAIPDETNRKPPHSVFFSFLFAASYLRFPRAFQSLQAFGTTKLRGTAHGIPVENHTIRG